MNVQNKKFTDHLGNKVRKFVEVDQTNLLSPSKALKIRVNCDLLKPLCRGLMLKKNNPTRFKMKYITLFDFGCSRGLLGYVYTHYVYTMLGAHN